MEREAKKCLRVHAKCAGSHHPALVQSIIRAFALYSYILLYPLILLADSEGPDQTAHPRSLIRAFTIRICPKTFSNSAAQIVSDVLSECFTNSQFCLTSSWFKRKLYIFEGDNSVKIRLLPFEITIDEYLGLPELSITWSALASIHS